MALNWLYLDLNSYFASVEQQLNPALRGRPVAVVPAMTDATCAIAASYEARAYGVSTGTMIYEAKRRCPGLICVQADHAHYVAYHHRILEEIDRHIPVEAVCSIDEVACRLMGEERREEKAVALARRIKQGIYEHVGASLRCSIGIAPNRFLAKTASNLQKPDGLQVLYAEDLPARISHWQLGDLTGLGHGMVRRLHKAGILSVEELFALSPAQMRALWGGVQGERYWHLLRGEELPPIPTQRRTIGHSHVLEPQWRPQEKARQVARRLLLKAASRLRRLGYHATRMQVSLRIEHGPRVEAQGRFSPACDNITLLHEAIALWDSLMRQHQPARIKKVSVTLSGLAESSRLQPDLGADT